MKPPVKTASFTLIELLVVVGFIIMFSGYSISYFAQYTEDKKLENAGKRITTMLDLVRTKTTAGDSSMCGIGVGQPKIKYYSFQVVNANQYSVVPVCEVGTPSPITYLNETNIIFPTHPAPTPPFPVITFFPVTGGTKCGYIYIKNTVLNSPNGKCRYIKTSESGLVKEDACTACNACPTGCP